jgi:hypothetical protein
MGYSIYALVDPRNTAIRYIGSTKNTVGERLGQHIHKARLIPETELAQWINGLVLLGLRPRTILLATAECRHVEKRWIRAFGDYDLLNRNWRK